MHAGRPTGPPSHGPGISPRSSRGSQVPSPVSGLCPCLHRLQSSGSLGTGARSWFIGPCPGASCIETQRRHSAMGLALMHCRLFQGNAAPKGCFSLPIHAEKNIGRCKKLTPLRGRFCCYRSSHQDSSGLLAVSIDADVDRPGGCLAHLAFVRKSRSEFFILWNFSRE